MPPPIENDLAIAIQQSNGCVVKKVIRDRMDENWREGWQSLPAASSFRKSIAPDVPSKNSRDVIFDLPRKALSVIMRLRFRRSPLNDDAFRQRRVQSPMCTICQHRETAAHYLLYCGAYEPARDAILMPFFRKAKVSLSARTFELLQRLLYSKAGVTATIRFVHETNRFN